MRGRNVTHVIRNITSAIQEVERWSFEWGFKLSVNKSCYMIITNKRKVNNVNLTLYGQPLQKVSEFKYLGLWLDNKYTWKTHIQHLETKCKKVINLLRAVAGCNWGADKQALMDIYKALMRSAIDYGCIIYGAAAKTTLQKIDRLQYRALRICTGLMKTTPINAVLIEAGETPLAIRRDKFSLTYWVKLKGSGDENPSTSTLKPCWEYSTFQRRGFGWEIGNKVKQFGMENLEFTKPNPISNVPPWLYPETKVDMSILEKKREWRLTEIGVKTSVYLRQNYYSYLKIFTDGSKNEHECVSIGVFIPEFNVHISKRISNRLSVYTAEVVAVVV